MNQTELVYKKTKGLSPFAYTVVGEWLYFCDEHIKALFRYHLEKEVCEYVVKFDGRYVNQNFYKMCAYGEELWLLPFSDGKIICFNMKKEESAYYDIPETVKEKRIPFTDMFFRKGKAYIVPRGDNRFLIEVDLETHGMREIELVKEKQGADFVSFLGAVQIQNQIYLAESTENILIMFDSDNDNLKIIDIEGYELEGLSPKAIEDEIWFVPVNSGKDILIYNVNSNSFMEKEYPIKGLPENEVCLFMVYNEEIWFLANQNKKIYKVNRDMYIEAEIIISDFNENDTVIYISGMLCANQFFWHGHSGTPLIRVKDGVVQILDVGEDKRLLEIYLETIGKRSVYEKTSGKKTVGEYIYYSLK